MVAQVGGQAGQRGTFHLEVGDAVVLTAGGEAEAFYVFQHVWHGQRQADNASLRTVKSWSGDGYALKRNVFHEVDNLAGCLHEIRGREVRVPVHVLFEGFLHFRDGDFFAVAVPVHDAVEAHADVCQHVAAQRDVCVQGAGGADAQDVEGAVLRLYLAGFEVHVGQGVQLCHHNVNVVRANPMGQGGDALAIVFAGYGDEFTRGVAELDVCQVFGNHVHAGRIAHHNYVIGQFLRFQVNVEHGAVAVDNKFRFRNSHSACGLSKTQI